MAGGLDEMAHGLGDAAAGAWHAEGHALSSGLDALSTVGHAMAAGWDAFWSDMPGAERQHGEAVADHAAAEREMHQANQELMGE